jgi:hypothetical protein
MTCRCGVNVKDCLKGCTLFACCGGYLTEGHMSDCKRATDATTHGIYRRPEYVGEW